MDKVSRPYQDELLKALMNPTEAAAYLNAALDEGSSELFIIALQNVANAYALQTVTPSPFDLSRISELLGTLGLRFVVDQKKIAHTPKHKPVIKRSRLKQHNLTKA